MTGVSPLSTLERLCAEATPQEWVWTPETEPDGVVCVVLTAAEVAALTRSIRADIAERAARATAERAWSGFTERTELGTTERRAALKAGKEADRLWVTARDEHAAALSVFAAGREAVTP